MNEHVYYITGMHCPSCEIVIEKKLLGFTNIRSVNVSSEKGVAVVEYENDLPNIGKLNSIFASLGYKFFNNPSQGDSPDVLSWTAYIWPVVVIILLFLILPKTKLASLVSVTASSSLPTFFVFGLLAGVSSCAALVGGIVLSMSKQWSELYLRENPFVKKIEPHLLFNIGRIISFAVLGGVLGLIGSTFKLSLTASAILVIVISIVMVVLALQMLGVRVFQRFQISAPKSMTRYVADEGNFKGKYAPFILGALTFFLPCGFTITVQSLALLSGSFIQGGLIMLLFALGTLPMLIAIGVSSVKFLSNPSTAAKFLRIAGTIVLFFALFNINSQINVLGLKSVSDIKVGSAGSSKDGPSVASNPDLPPIIDGKQVVKMKASATGYSPSNIKIRAGIPVKWEIEDVGTSGCTNAIISKSLFPDSISLTNGQTSVKEFTVAKAGTYKFSCWMGMISGSFEAVGAR